MRRLAAAAAALTLFFAQAADARELRYDLVPDGAITLASGGLLVADRLFAPSLAPKECRFCGGNPFDRTLTEHLRWDDHDLAAGLSDVTAFIVLPAGAIGYSFIADGGRGGLIDTLILTETVALTIVGVDMLKYAVGRERPRAIYLSSDESGLANHPLEENLSFPSGHTAIAFSIVATVATVTDLRGGDPLPIWLVGLPIATAVGYLRVAGIWHWTTDVLAGAAIGTAAGVFLPRLLHSQADSAGSGSSDAPKLLQLGGVW